MQSARRTCPGNLREKRRLAVLPFLSRKTLGGPHLSSALIGVFFWAFTLSEKLGKNCVPGGNAFQKSRSISHLIPEAGQCKRDVSGVVRGLPVASLQGAFWKDVWPPGYFKELGARNNDTEEAPLEQFPASS